MSQTEITATERQVIAANTEQLHARIRHLERELTAERIAHKTQTNMAQRLFDELSALREGVEKLAEKSRNGWKVHTDELLALLK